MCCSCVFRAFVMITVFTSMSQSLPKSEVHMIWLSTFSFMWLVCYPWKLLMLLFYEIHVSHVLQIQDFFPSLCCLSSFSLFLAVFFPSYSFKTTGTCPSLYNLHVSPTLPLGFSSYESGALHLTVCMKQGGQRKLAIQSPCF